MKRSLHVVRYGKKPDKAHQCASATEDSFFVFPSGAIDGSEQKQQQAAAAAEPATSSGDQKKKRPTGAKSVPGAPQGPLDVASGLREVVPAPEGASWIFPGP